MKTISVQVDDETVEKIRIAAFNNKETRAQFIRRAIYIAIMKAKAAEVVQ